MFSTHAWLTFAFAPPPPPPPALPFHIMVWPLHVSAARRWNSGVFLYIPAPVESSEVLPFLLSEANAEGKLRVRAALQPWAAADFTPLLPASGGRRLFRLWHHEERKSFRFRLGFSAANILTSHYITLIVLKHLLSLCFWLQWLQEETHQATVQSLFKAQIWKTCSSPAVHWGAVHHVHFRIKTSELPPAGRLQYSS